MKYFLIFILPLTFSTNVLSKDQDHKLVIDTFGYELVSEFHYKEIETGESTNGLSTTSSTTVICETTDIPLKLENAFGVQFKLVGPKTLDDLIGIEIETSYPSLVNILDEISNSSRWEANIYDYKDGGYLVWASFLFEEEYELVEGEWSISAFYGDQKVSQKFYVSYLQERPKCRPVHL